MKDWEAVLDECKKIN